MSVITRQIGYLIGISVTLSFLSGCVQNPPQQSEPVAKQPPLKKIGLIAVTNPPMLSIENRGSAWGLLALPGAVLQRQDQITKSNTLTTGMRNQSLHLGEEMSSALQDELKRKGYEVSVITDVAYLPDDPEAIDYQHIQTDADAVISAQYSVAGLYSGPFSLNYIPRLNISFAMVRPKDQSELYSQSIYYGADARKPAEDQIPADPKYAYGSFDQVMEKQGEVVEGFRVGVRGIAALVAQQIHQTGL
jgi:hypothetical protein